MTNEEENTEEQENPEETPEAQSQEKSENINNRISIIEKEQIENKKKELAEMEKKLDKKMDALKEIVGEVEKHGITYAGQPKETEEQKIEKMAEDVVNSYLG